MRYLVFFLAVFAYMSIQAQEASFSLELRPLAINEFGGIQSFSYGQADGKILIIGGRLDGLHRRQPWASFDIDGHNTELIVIDPESGEKWTRSLDGLSSSIQEQLSSTNMEFYQEGDFLYCLGGYGYSASQSNHTTYPYLTAVDVPGVVEAITKDQEIAGYFRQIEELAFQVTGGKLKKIEDVYHLLGGQKFIGRYNPMGPDHGPGFIQDYTNSIRRFTLEDDGLNISIQLLESYEDRANLHRRDYNAEPQIMPDGSEGITMFSGVFREDVDWPFLTSVDVREEGYTHNDSFKQKFNHYHCPVPMYSVEANMMFNVFFGGIARYYEEDGMIVRDDDVPFVKTIALVMRDKDGNMKEEKLPIEMPGYLGAGAEFIAHPNLLTYSNGVIDYDLLGNDTVLLGYILGGINSSDRNIFFINNGEESTASNALYEVMLVKNSLTSTSAESSDLFDLKIRSEYNGAYNVGYRLTKSTNVEAILSDMTGRLIKSFHLGHQLPGTHFLELRAGLFDGSGIYVLKLATDNEEISKQFFVSN